MKGYVTDLERATIENEDFRRVLFTGPNTQLVVMTLQPGEAIGLETHDGHDQFVRVEQGEGFAELDGKRHPLSEGSAVVIPAGVAHDIVNASKDARLRLYTLYSPPEHPEGTVHRTRREAAAAHA